MTTEMLARAFAMTRGILANVTHDDHDKPTPCASWNVRAVANHIVEGANWFALCVNGGAAPDPDPTHGVDYAAGDLLAAYDQGVVATLEAFGAPGAQQRIITLPFGQLPGAAFMGIATNDVFTHGWDIAKSTGQSTDLDSEIAVQLLAQVQGFVTDAFRGPDGQAPFGPEVAVPSSASAADKLAAFLGRHPS